MSDRTRGSSSLDEADIELLERLGAIAEVVDPVPDHVLEMSRALFAFRDPDAELMEAVELDSDRLEAVRGSAPTSRMHFFEFGEMSVDVEIIVVGLVHEVMGWVADPGGTTDIHVTLQTKPTSSTSTADDEGRFHFKDVPSGMIRLVLNRGERQRLVTPWFHAG